jgi:MOSC domain-containing protein YiiM
VTLQPSAAGATGTIVAVARDDAHRFSKPTRESITLIAGFGVEGDAHAGATVKHRSRVARDASTPNLRQVHLIHSELFHQVAARGHRVRPGELGENVTTAGVDLLALPRGTRLELGDEAVVEVTGLRNPCKQINGLSDGLMKELVYLSEDGETVRLAGVMSIVLTGGVIRPGDPIRVVPPADFEPLGPV